ncbi:MAG: multiprotein bridging factor aMBF1 [Candidatus Thermoplasmatota archaeon]|nr:multiprotein bridging factor aMBF1 [Candidatus Thermoplasmatota archaeon]
MRCELCGKEEDRLRRVIIEGTEMLVCSSCVAYGKAVPVSKGKVSPVVSPSRKEYYGKDIFKKMDKEIVPDWGARIRKAREEHGLSRQELGALVGERTTAISKIENQELRPPDEKAKKLEKVLGIVLFQDVKQAVLKKRNVKRFTIGDLLKKNE